MDNLETQATLDIRHKTMKKKKPNCSRRVSSSIISRDGLYNLMTQFKKKNFNKETNYFTLNTTERFK